MDKEIHDFKFNVADVSRIKIKNIRGSIDIKQGKNNEIKVQVIKHPDSCKGGETNFIVEQESESVVSAYVDFEYKKAFRINSPCRIDFIIEVPANCQVRAKNVSGTISLLNINGDHRLKSVSGSVKFSGVEADAFAAKSVSGSINGVSLKCTTAEISTVSGSIGLSEMDINELDVSSVSGGIKFEGSLGSARHDIGSVSGSINLKIPEDTNLDFKASSISGSLKSNLNIKFTSISRKRWIGQLNEGGSLLKLKTVSGSMKINSL
jgi:DUF4097 and DUF4098 domain-containing protein YvlB